MDGHESSLHFKPATVGLLAKALTVAGAEEGKAGRIEWAVDGVGERGHNGPRAIGGATVDKLVDDGLTEVIVFENWG
jgi:hypothetical protein